MRVLPRNLLIGLSVVVVAAGLILATKPRGSSAQPPAGEAMGGPNGPFAEFRKSHEYTFKLTRLLRNIGRLEAEGKSPLTPSQAKAVLAALKPLRKQTSLTQDQAKEAIKKLQRVLTVQQRTLVGKMRPEHRFAKGGGHPGRPPKGQRPNFDPSAMENFNPFNPPRGSSMSERGSNQLDKMIKALEKKAGGRRP